MGTVVGSRLVPLVLLALTGLAWPATAPAQAPEPSLRLVAPGGPVTLHRLKGRVTLDLGVWVAATGGDFELRAVRPDYDTPAAVKQVDAETGDVLRTLPSTTLDGWLGFSRFVTVVVKGPGGRIFRQVRYTWCPNGWERQRVDDSGPELPRYPAFCASSAFTKGMVWGIESGWATSVLGSIDAGAPSIRLPRAGKFIFEVRIARPYPGLFDIATADAQVTLDVTVENVRQQPCCEEGRAGRSAAAAPARSRAVPDVDDPDPSTVPDLVALPLWSMTAFRTKRRDFLGFAATPWNAGPAPLVVEGFRRRGESVMDAYQYFRDEDGDVVGRAAVGEMAFHSHPEHNHWHFLQFARFSLHDASNLEVVRSRKQAYCLAPTDPIDLTLERASFSPWEGVSTNCGSPNALWVREVLQTGWADTYFQGIPGQSFDITTVPNGWYYARLEVNPFGALHEVTRVNNVESRLVHLGGRRGHRTVLAAPWHGIVD
jgi:Lysyl oxidase